MKRTIFNNKPEREKFEIETLISLLNTGVRPADWRMSWTGLKPDALLQDSITGRIVCVESTSVYQDDFSVAREHLFGHDKPIHIEEDPRMLRAYELRILRTMRRKDRAYRLMPASSPRILLVYVNEYIAIHLSKMRIIELIISRLKYIDNQRSFHGVVLWGVFDPPVILMYGDFTFGDTRAQSWLSEYLRSSVA
ncbi:MAG: hypothetical protein JW384_00725 [Nitrosomonadaceae bacterium]|nr:hypothetical protein [Nitrosomonadaceae bacterium]